MAALANAPVTCPACGTGVTLPVTATLDSEITIAVVVVDKGTAWAHMRDEHPETWQQMCEARRRMNANPYIAFMPRKVDGTFLRAGEDVGDV